MAKQADYHQQARYPIGKTCMDQKQVTKKSSEKWMKRPHHRRRRRRRRRRRHRHRTVIYRKPNAKARD